MYHITVANIAITELLMIIRHIDRLLLTYTYTYIRHHFDK